MDWLSVVLVVDSLFRRKINMYQPKIKPYEFDAVIVRMGKFGFGMKRSDLCDIQTWVHEFTEHALVVHWSRTAREMRFQTKTIEIRDKGIGRIGNIASPAHIMASFVAGTNTDDWQTFYTPDDYERHVFGNNGKMVVIDKRTNPDPDLVVEDIVKTFDMMEKISKADHSTMKDMITGFIVREVMKRQGMTIEEDKNDE